MAQAGIRDRVNAAADALDSDIYAYFGDIVRGEDAYMIKRCQEDRLRKNAVLLLTTYGGDPNTAYRIARCFQDAYKTREIRKNGDTGDVVSKKEGKFTIVVQGVCKSAGTIICLGADEICMSANAELGPIDVQLRKQDEVGERTSGLTPIQAIQFLETQSVALFKRHFRELRFSDDLSFSTKMAADIAGKMAIGLLNPVYEQIDPIRLAEVDRSLRISSEYGKRLKTENVKDGGLERLIASYPSHGFVIDRKEAKEIFKEVNAIPAELNEVLGFFSVIADITLDKGDTFVHVLSDPPKEAPAEQPAQPEE